METTIEGFTVSEKTQQTLEKVFNSKRRYSSLEYQAFFIHFRTVFLKFNGCIHEKHIRGTSWTPGMGMFLVSLETGRALEDMILLTTADICRIFVVTSNALRIRLSRSPETLPRPIKIPGFKGLRWTKQSVQAFIDEHANEEIKPLTINDIVPPPKRKTRGRPSYVGLGKRQV